MIRLHQVSGVVALVMMRVLLPDFVLSGQEATSDRFTEGSKNLAPVSADALEVHLRPPVVAELDNGIRVLVLEDHRAPTVSLQLRISGAGALYDPPQLPGLAALTATMLQEGTLTRTNEAIADELLRLGATLASSSVAGSAATVISASGLRRNMDEWFGILTDVLLNPSFPDSELRRLKVQGMLGLARQQASGAFLAEERFYSALYGDHPAGSRTATQSSLTDLAVGVIAGWHRERYAPQNSILAIAGDIDADQIVPWLNEQLMGWEPNGHAEILPPDPTEPDTRRTHLVDRPDSVQTTLIVGNLSVDRGHPDYIPLRVLNEILGGSPRSRLIAGLVDENEYAYGAYSSISALRYPGPLSASAAVRFDAVGRAIDEIFSEIERLREEPIPVGELDRAKRSIVASFALSLEDPESLLTYFTLRETYDFPDDYWDTYAARVMEVTAGDVARVAVEYLDLETMQVVVVGDASEILSEIEAYGPVDLYDVDGNRLNQ